MDRSPLPFRFTVSHTLKLILTSLLLLALTVRGMIAVGFMVAPSADDAGAMTVVICTEHGLQTLDLDRNGDPIQDGTDVDTLNTCPFSTVGHFAFHHDHDTSLTGTVEYSKITFRTTYAQFQETPKPGALKARGPPLQRA